MRQVKYKVFFHVSIVFERARNKILIVKKKMDIINF